MLFPYSYIWVQNREEFSFFCFQFSKIFKNLFSESFLHFHARQQWSFYFCSILVEARCLMQNKCAPSMEKLPVTHYRKTQYSCRHKAAVKGPSAETFCFLPSFTSLFKEHRLFLSAQSREAVIIFSRYAFAWKRSLPSSAKREAQTCFGLYLCNAQHACRHWQLRFVCLEISPHRNAHHAPRRNSTRFACITAM